MENKNFLSSPVAWIVLVVVILCCCCCVVLLGSGAAGLYFFEKQVTSQDFSTPFNTDYLTPVPHDATSTPEASSLPQPTRVENVPTDTLNTLQQAVVPENDPYALACHLQGICGVPTAVPAPAKPPAVGDQQKFWLTNSSTNENFQIDAKLLYITPHTYFWAENGADVNTKDMKALMDTFETKIYPTDREFFGSEWTPGVDNDPHIYVIYASNIGGNIAGYFSSVDELNPQVRKDSNGHEAFVISTTQNLADEYTYTVLAHEFVHMIQWPSDRNDVSWINEGFADVGAFLNGYGVGGADWEYASNPDLQLNTWEDNSSPDFSRHYGMSFLYLTYFLDRFGEKATKALTANPQNDLTSVDGTLKDLNITDPQTGKIITADDVFMDWAATNYLLDGSVGDGRYIYHNYKDAPKVEANETISNCPSPTASYTVHQYGVDYIKITCNGKFTLHFEGDTAAKLLPVDPHSGKYAFWSNKGDESDMTLTREFDFSDVSAPIALNYQTWYDLEKDYDYVFVEASIDGGQTWQILKTPSGTDKNPSGNSYGWGYTSASNSWLAESVDLSAYAGQKVQVRFEYVTDAAVNGEGFLLDDVSIPAVNYSTDFETDDGGWKANGFARIENILPQTFRLALILKSGKTTVQTITVNPDQTAEINLDLGLFDSAVLVVSGTTRFTRDVGDYSITIK